MIERHELTALAKSMGLVVRSVVGPLHAEIKELRAECTRLAQLAPVPGPAGRDADPEAIRVMVSEAVAELPPPQAGPAGKDADMDWIFQTVTEQVQKAVAALPPAPAGPAGPPGRDIEPESLAELIHEHTTRESEKVMEELSSRCGRIITAQMSAAIANIPAPVPGPAGPAGKDAEPLDMTPYNELVKTINIELNKLEADNTKWRQDTLALVLERAVPGPAGPAGKDADTDGIRNQLAQRLSEEFKLLTEDCEEWKRNMQALITERAVPGPQGPAGRDAEPIDLPALRGHLLSTITDEFQRLSGQCDLWQREALAELLQRAVPGPQGPAGEVGPAGRDAEPIHPDTLRLAVVEEVRAAISQIPKPADGEKGDPGRDAAELEILSTLQEGKAYPRGTFAYHLGGMVRAFRKTDPFSETEPLHKLGWEVVVDGLHGWSCEQSADMRSFTISAQTTGGRVHASTFQLPALIYREIYEQGKTYVRGDVVTYGGHAWHCGVESTTQKPGIGTHWRMMVKEGRPGKQGPEGPAGKDGKDGRDGRDLTQMSYDGGKH